MTTSFPLFLKEVTKLSTIIKKRTSKSVKTVLNKNFTFSDLSPRFENVDSSTGNIFCPFHENHTSPAAKMYWDEVNGIWVIWCFTEHKHFTAYDYVKLILCEKYQKYKSPLDFLTQNMDKNELYAQLDIVEKQNEEQLETSMSTKVDYINWVFGENENTEDYIEALYLG